MYRLLLLPFFVLSCALSKAQVFPDTTWQNVAHPTFYGWDNDRLESLREYVTDSTATTGMMIVQDGRVIFQYGNITENSYIASCRKSVLAMLYGKHVETGSIDLSASLKDLGITHNPPFIGGEVEATVEDIITSRSGIYLQASNPGDMTHLAPERGSVKAGGLWIYNNWDFNMAGHIFERQIGGSIYDEIDTQFARPLQMQDWDRARQQKSGDMLRSDIEAYHMDFSARDMARLGVLMLNKGKWKTEQIIPEAWVEYITMPSTTAVEVEEIAAFVNNEFTDFSYGAMWWLLHEPDNDQLAGAYSAQGAWGQNITILPRLNAVVVIKTNNLYQRRKGDHNYILDEIGHCFSHNRSSTMAKLKSSLEAEDISQFVVDYKETFSEKELPGLQNDLNTLAYSYLEGKEYSKALALFNLNVDRHPESWLAHDGLAEAYYYTKDFERSLEHYQNAVALNKDDEWGNNGRLAPIIDRLKIKIDEGR